MFLQKCKLQTTPHWYNSAQKSIKESLTKHF